MSQPEIPENMSNTLKKTFMKFLSFVPKAGLKRNVLGPLFVILPEIPAYLIPAYSEAKSTGSAENVKKGEGARGLLTGAFEGLAVGAIVSAPEEKETIINNVKKTVQASVKDAGMDLSYKKIIPFVIVAAGVQFISSKIFPIIGEKLGQSLYTKNQSLKNDVLAYPDASSKNTMPALLTTKPLPLKPVYQNKPASVGLKI